MKFLSLTLITLAGVLTSAFALPNSSPNPGVSISQAGIDVNEVISSIKATERKRTPLYKFKLFCYDSKFDTWAVDGLQAISQVGKKAGSLKGKNIYDIAGKFCHENNGHQFHAKYESIRQRYFFKNTLPGFPLPFTPVSFRVLNYDKRPGRLDATLCTNMMVRLILTCIGPGRPSVLKKFRGGEVQHENGWTYNIICDEDYCQNYPWK
ncbi:hypothetical protein GX50_05566 [[Emmonsia] crescens]|uniref:Uncharacterized protein n=1 Tax=[Emmonsia] crescens TaxID=73230 RepID=A0A2B7ZF97_9EURO|nr:hypothetical protein GX50_05566 [Emmonsia crescens]